MATAPGGRGDVQKLMLEKGEMVRDGRTSGELEQPGGFAPRPPGFIALVPGLIGTAGASDARSPSILAPGSALRLPPGRALFSAPAGGEFTSFREKNQTTHEESEERDIREKSID